MDKKLNNKSLNLTKVMKVQMVVEQIVALWMEEGFSVMRGNASRQNTLVTGMSIVMTEGMKVPMFVEQIVAL